MGCNLHCIWTLDLLLPWEVRGVGCTRKMVPVGEERAKVVTPLTDIQLLHPVTATMLGKGQEGMRGKGRREGGGREEETKNGGWGMKQEIGRREKIMSMTAR